MLFRSYRLWVDEMAGLVPAPTPGNVGGASGGIGSITPPIGHVDNPAIARLPHDMPSIGVPVAASTGWLRSLAERLFVRAGRLEYGLGVPIVLVRLPPCAGPRGIRAGNKVDRAGGRAYAQPR